MARFLGAMCKLCRREGTKLFLKGTKCGSSKCAVEKKNVAPGQHGDSRKSKTEYAMQLREKQKTKRTYGMLEKQFHSLFKKADNQEGVTGENLLIFLERRFDNVVYKMGLVPSKKTSRQLITHKHFLINGKPVNVPSYVMEESDTVEVREKSKKLPIFKELKESKVKRLIPSWIESNIDELKGKVIRLPKREDIDLTIKEQLIVELYSK